MAFQVLTTTAASITELKRDPMGTFNAGEGAPVAILNRNEPAF
ncbi:plasmid stabilization protein, partial [Klebsiella pneumoniae]